MAMFGSVFECGVKLGVVKSHVSLFIWLADTELL
jgi:hypothetical protein